MSASALSSRGKREPDDQLLARMAGLLAPYLTLTGKTRANPPHRLVEVTCSKCQRVSWKRANDLQHGKGGCPCQWAEKYDRDPRARVLRDRYHAMVQRCTPGTPTSRYHGDLGIQMRFTSVGHFIRWALENLPHESYRGVTFDRIDSEGHYEPGNLRLATYREQAMNTSHIVRVLYMGQQVVRHHLWHLVKTDQPDFPLSPDGLVRRLQRGMTVEQAISPPFRLHGSTTSSTPDPVIVSLYRD